jgi:hypothetical protein
MNIETQEELYKLISENDLYTKSFDEFKTQFANPQSQSRLYNGMVSEGLYPVDKQKEEFVNQFFGVEKKNPIQTVETEDVTVSQPISEKPKSSSGGGMVAMAPISESESQKPKPGKSQGALLIPPKEVKLPSIGTLKGVQDLSNYDVTKKGWFNPNADIKIDIPVVSKRTLQASKDLAQQVKSLNQESSLLDNEIATFNEFAKSNPNNPIVSQKQKELDDKIALQKKKSDQVQIDINNVNQDRADLKKASVQNFINKKDEGNFFGATWNSIVEGYTKIGQAQARVTIDLGIELLDKIGIQWAPDNAKLTKDEAKKEVINQMMPTIAKGYEQVKDKGTSKEYIEAQKASGTLPKAWFGAMESIPVMASGPGLGGTIPRFVTGASLAYQYANEQLDSNPATFDMDENERKKITVPTAVIGGILEEIGFRTLIGKNKPALIGLTNLIIKQIPKNAGIEAIKQITKQVVKTPAALAIVSGSGKLATAYLGEAETGGAQKVSDFAIKEIYDSAKNLNLFKNPKFLSNEFLSQVAEDANVEGIGGVMMRAIGLGASKLMSVKGAEGMSDKEYKAWTDLASDADQLQLYLTKVAADVSSGRITQEEGQKRIDTVQKATEIVDQIPNELSIPDQKRAYDIIANNLQIDAKIKELNDYMAGKNTNLVANINAEIEKLQKQIEKNNQELSKIPQNAVQEQTTSEVPIQPEAGVGEQVAEREPKPNPQVPTEEDKTEEVKPEGAGGKIQMAENEQPVAEEPVVEEAPKEQPISLSEGQKNAVQEGIKKALDMVKRYPKLDDLLLKYKTRREFQKKNQEYINANQFQKDEMIRQMNIELKLAPKKAAPGVEKLVLKPKPQKATVNTKTVLYERLKEIDQSIKEGQKNVKQAIEDMASEIKGMLPKGIFSTSQVKVVINGLASNLLNPRLRQAAIDRVDRMANNVAEATKLKNVYDLHQKIKNINTDKLATELADIAKGFAKINPKHVDNLDNHIEEAEKLLNAIKNLKVTEDEDGNKTLETRTPLNYASSQDYIQKQLDKQEEILKEALLDQYAQLVAQGKISDTMTLPQIKAYLKSIEEDPKNKKDEKDKLVMDFAKESFDESKQKLQQALDDGTINPKDVKVIKAFLNVDPSLMQPLDAMEAAEAALNYIENESTSKMGKIASNFYGAYGAKTISESISRDGKVNVGGTKYKIYKGVGKIFDILLKALTLGKSKTKIGEFLGDLYSDSWLEYNTPINNLGATYFGPNNWDKIREAIGLNEISDGSVAAKKIVSEFGKKIYEKYKNKEVDGNNVFTEKVSNVIGIISNLYRETSDPRKQEEYFKDRKNILKEAIDFLLNSKNEKDQKKGQLWQDIYDELDIENATSGQDIFNNANPIVKNIINDFINKYGENYPEFSQIAQEQFNIILGQDKNYTADSWQNVGNVDQSSADKLFNKGRFITNHDIVETEESGRFIKPKYPSKLPTKNGKVNRIPSYDFFKDNMNALSETINTVKTIGGINQYAGFMDSPYLEKLITDEDSRKLFKDRMDFNVSLYQRNEKIPRRNKYFKAGIDAISKYPMKFGSTLGLSAAESIFTQSLPIVANTVGNLRNPLYLGLASQYAFNPGMRDFLNSLNKGIAERGGASQTNIDYVNNMLENGDYSTPDKALENMKKAMGFLVDKGLVGTDVLTAKTTWMAYYMDELAKQGINPRDINWSNHEVNENSARYAEKMVAKEQNINLSEEGGRLWASRDVNMKAARMFFPFANFTTNQKDKIKTNMAVLFMDNNLATAQEKIAAARSLVATGVEQLVFNGIKSLVSTAIVMGAYNIVGKKEDEEKRKLRQKKTSERLYRNFLETFGGTSNMILKEVDAFSADVLLRSFENIITLFNEAIDKKMTPKQFKDKLFDLNWLTDNKAEKEKPEIFNPFGDKYDESQAITRAKELREELKEPFRFSELKRKVGNVEPMLEMVGGVPKAGYDTWIKMIFKDIPILYDKSVKLDKDNEEKLTREELNNLLRLFPLKAAGNMGFGREPRKLYDEVSKIIEEEAQMRSKVRKADWKRINKEFYDENYYR